MLKLERRLMVGQEILVLFIMVRIRAPQPKIQPAFCRFNFCSRTDRCEPTGRSTNTQMNN